MSIASALASAQQKVANAYTAISNKGGTLPATQNLANMPTAIDSIPTGATQKFGLTIDNIVGDVDSEGNLSSAQNANSLIFTGVKTISGGALSNKLSGIRLNSGYSIEFPDLEILDNGNSLDSTFVGSNVSSISFPKITEISGTSSFYSTFKNCYFLTSINFPLLKKMGGVSNHLFCCASSFSNCGILTMISFPELEKIGENNTGTGNCTRMFENCTSLESVSLPKLKIVGSSQDCSYMFSGCTSLISIEFTSLSEISGSQCFLYMFNNCRALSSLSFPSLTTTSFGSSVNQLANMFNNLTASTSGTCTVHFPSNMQTTISGLTGYPTFGGNSSRIVLAFDLSETS